MDNNDMNKNIAMDGENGLNNIKEGDSAAENAAPVEEVNVSARPVYGAAAQKPEYKNGYNAYPSYGYNSQVPPATTPKYEQYTASTADGYSYTYNQPVTPAKKKKEKKKGSLGGGVIALLLVAVFILGAGGAVAGNYLYKRFIGGGSGNTVIYQNVSSDDSAVGVDSTGAKSSDDTTQSVVNKTSASVVEITTSSVQTGSFFGDYVTTGAGSGVIISKDGYIATNNHVIDGASDIKVTLKSGKEYKAELIGTDEKTDIAVLKIDADNLSPAVYGDSTKLAVGETIVVIGNPLGELGGSVSQGIISAKDREITVENEVMTLLQIDAAVNPGNSGGALFNLNGELVGIVNAKYSSEEVEGLGFAIPVNTAKSTIEDLIKYGYVKGRAMSGINAVEISDMQTALSYGVSELGVYVYSVNDGSGAKKAGIKSGDRIVSIDGKDITTTAELSKAIDSHSVGDKVKFVISRGGKEIEAEVTLAEYKPDASAKNKTQQKTTSSGNSIYDYIF